MIEQKFFSLFGLTVAIVCSISSCNKDPGLAMNTSNRSITPALKATVMSDVTLRVLKTTNENLLLELRNNSGHSIFVSHIPPDKTQSSTFLAYTLQRKTLRDDAFTQYGDGFHYGPNLHPITSQGTVTFRLVQFPEETGEYRVQVGYYDDELVYKMISERLTEMTEAERKQADESRKYVFSDAFFVPPKKRRPTN